MRRPQQPAPCAGNRHQRRAEAAARKQPPKSDPLADGLRAIHAEAGGVIELHLARQCDAAGLILLAAAGDPLAVQLRRVVLDTVAKIAAAPANKPMLCFACPDGELRDMASVARVGLIAPHRADRTTGIGFAICSACAAADIDARVLAALRRQLWPNLRPITITGGGGRA